MSPRGTRVSPPRMQVADHAHCVATKEVLTLVGDKWSLYLVSSLAQGPRRFNELKRLVEGISQRMLTLTLRGLERDGLVSRKVTPTIPPRVDYALTRSGRTLMGPVQGLVRWAEKHRFDIQAAREAFERGEAERKAQGKPERQRLRGGAGRLPFSS